MRTLEEINAEIAKVEERISANKKILAKDTGARFSTADESFNDPYYEIRGDTQLLQRRLTSLYALRWYLDPNAKSLSEL